MPKIKRYEGDKQAKVFYCPGCQDYHAVNDRWIITGTDDAPTIRPSVLSNGNIHCVNPAIPRCHLFVTDGKIQYLSDCTHALAGQTVEMVEMEEVS